MVRLESLGQTVACGAGYTAVGVSVFSVAAFWVAGNVLGLLVSAVLVFVSAVVLDKMLEWWFE